MSRIDDLIRDLCPDGVEYRTIGSLGQWRGGGTPSKSRPEFWENGTIPWVSPKDMGSYELASTQDKITLQATRESSANLVPGPSLAVVSRSSILQHTLPVSIVPFEASFNQDTKTLTPHKNVNLHYAAHVLRAHANSILATTSKRGGSVNSLILPKFLEYKVPIPPLPIQEEIVRTLSNFAHLATRLEMELKAELEARQQQYTHYRRLLIAKASQDAPLVSLHDLGTWHGGITPSKKRAEFWNSPDIHWLTPKDMSSETVTSTIDHVSYQALTETPLKHLPENCVAFVFRSNILRRKLPIAIIQPRVTLNQDMRALVTHNDISANYVAEVCLAQQDLLRSRFVRTDGSMAAVESKALFNHEIPVPSPRKQAQIADQLAAFRSIYTDLTSSLPTEIEARRKQYEYYRDRLLTFPEKK